jgi:hypothetical protein
MEVAYMKGDLPPTPNEREEDWKRCERATFQDGADGEQRTGIVASQARHMYTINPLILILQMSLPKPVAIVSSQTTNYISHSYSSYSLADTPYTSISP